MGQVFLKTNWPVQRMVERLTELRVERVLEIGPGAGVLTRGLLDAGMHVTAVEKDARFAERLGLQSVIAAAQPETSLGRLAVVNDDILQFDWEAWAAAGSGRCAVVGNIPYNISSPIVLRGLAVMERLTAMMFMTQLEFAARVVARPSTKDFGSLSVFAQLRAELSLEFKVDRTCFQPVPKVDSAVFLALPKRDRLPDEVLRATEQVTRAAFTQRRKKLRNSVKQFLETKGEVDCPIDLERRCDSLAPREFVELATFLLS